MFAKEGKNIIITSLAIATILTLCGYIWAVLPLKIIALLSALWSAFCLWFFRDPERNNPGAENTVVSPADGKVVKVASQNDEELGETQVVSIFMSVFSVHVNRMPLAGKIISVVHSDGKFLNAVKAEASFENENVKILIETAAFKYRVVQIAGLIARRIVPYVKPGDVLRRGQRFGMIKFGSKVDLVLPPNVTVSVKPGDKVHAGESVIGVVND